MVVCMSRLSVKDFVYLCQFYKRGGVMIANLIKLGESILINRGRNR
jgi:hypothetical protein